MKMFNRFGMWLILAAVPAFGFAAFGCGGGDDDDDDDDDDASFGDDDGDAWDDFLDALPSGESLAMTMPGDDEEKGLGDLAELYDDTVDVTRDVNHYVLSVLSIIDDITSYPPTGQDADTYTWGPWQDTGLDPVEMLFEITQTGDHTYDYALRWRPKNTTDEWTDVWFGGTVASTETARRGDGGFTIDYTAAQSLDPTYDWSGTIDVEYDTVSDGREIDVTFNQFFDEHGDLDGPVDANYAYHNHADNSGEFTFDYWTDVHAGTFPEYPEEEHVFFNVRWADNGPGRADVTITDGDISDISLDPLPHSAESYDASECWNDLFKRTYYDEWFELDVGGEYRDPDFPEGYETDCTFTDRWDPLV